jgi:hypothetical protein
VSKLASEQANTGGAAAAAVAPVGGAGRTGSGTGEAWVPPPCLARAACRRRREALRQRALQLRRAIENHAQSVVIFAEIRILHHLLDIGFRHKAADADAKAAAKAIVAGAFGVAGQNCLSVQRVYVHTSLFDEVLELVTTGTRALRTGPKLDRGTDVGPLISEAEARRVEEWVEEAKAAGATVHAGGQRRNAYYEPTVLADVPSDCKVIAEEVFGPVVSILPFIEIRDAVYSANNTEYGLQAGVFTQSIDLALAIAEKLHVGAVVINETSDVRIDSMPFGGFKKSGVGREGVRHAVREMTEPKNTIINLGESKARWQVLGGLTEGASS